MCWIISLAQAVVPQTILWINGTFVWSLGKYLNILLFGYYWDCLLFSWHDIIDWKHNIIDYDTKWLMKKEMNSWKIHNIIDLQLNVIITENKMIFFIKIDNAFEKIFKLSLISNSFYLSNILKSRQYYKSTFRTKSCSSIELL